MNRPFRLVLANLCETSYGYGSGAAEYLRAAILQAPELRDEVDVHIVFVEGIGIDGVAETILSHKPDLVGFTAYSWNLAATADVSRSIRRLDADVPIVWGGCSFLHLRQRNDWFEWWDAADAVAVGPGERTLIDLIGRLRARPGRQTAALVAPGLVVHERGMVRVGPAAEAVDPRAYESPYRLGIAAHVPRPYVEMARGCIFDCAFCSDAKGSRGTLFHHPAERIAAEVAEIVSWPEAEWVDAGASTANVSDAAFLAVCEGIVRGDPSRRLQYSLQLYPSLVRPAHRRALDGIRIGKHLVGLQSLSRDTFAPMRRGAKLEHLERAIEVLRGTGPIYVSIILGLPGETYASFAAMMDSLIALDDVHLSVHRLLVLPGTEMHTRHEELGLGFDPARYYRATHSATMPADDLRRAQELVVKHAAAQGASRDSRPRIDWTNFDVQSRAFDPPIQRTGLP